MKLSFCLLTLWVLLFNSTLIYLLYPYFSDKIGLSTSSSGFDFILPITLFFSGLNVIWLGILNRNKLYLVMSLSLVIKALTTVCVSLFLYKNSSFNGLILGFLFGLIASNLLIIIKCFEILTKIELFDFRQIVLQAKKYKSFPLFNASTSLFDGLFSLPIYFIGAFFAVEQLGIYYFLNRILVAPLSLISNSLSPIILKDSAEYLSKKQSINKFFIGSFKKLAFIGATLGLIFFLVVMSIISFGLDERWAAADQFVYLLMPLAIVRFSISTLSPIFSSTKRNDLAGIWKLLSFVISFGIYSSFAQELNFYNFVACICVVETCLYIFSF